MDRNDAKNRDGSKNIDRHDCVTLDVNRDKLKDIVCVIGADKGRGWGYNELYLSKPDGTLRKIATHGLQKYPWMSTRLTTKLKHAPGGQLIFVGTNGRQRPDGRKNAHRMFKVTGKAPWFQELGGPWIKEFNVICAVTADINMDGLDE